MPHQPYFVIVLAHSLHGRLRRIHIPHKAVYAAFVWTLLGSLCMFGLLSSYLRMSWKVAHYNSLREEVDSLRAKYQELQRVTNQKNEQLATLEVFASEVSVAYGLEEQTGNVGRHCECDGIDAIVPRVAERIQLLEVGFHFQPLSQLPQAVADQRSS